MDWAQILVIILASFLALFLLLSIILVVVLIRLSRQIKSVAGSAERTVKTFEKAAARVHSLMSPLVAMKAMTKIIHKRKGKKPHVKKD